jgi:hypothetical protein
MIARMCFSGRELAVLAQAGVTSWPAVLSSNGSVVFFSIAGFFARIVARLS